MFPKKPAIIGRWRWRLSCLLVKKGQPNALSPADQLHINIKHPLRQNYRRFLAHHSAPAQVMRTNA